MRTVDILVRILHVIVPGTVLKTVTVPGTILKIVSGTILR